MPKRGIRLLCERKKLISFSNNTKNLMTKSLRQKNSIKTKKKQFFKDKKWKY